MNSAATLVDVDTSTLPDWFRSHGRHHLPWRQTRDPWAVLVSEVMLQQTPAARVQSRWRAWLDRWPTPHACAAAPLDEVLTLWSGLGYPRRARNLWQAAQQLALEGWPDDERGLRGLAGIGAYTARALLHFVEERDAPLPCDINLTRIGARAGHGCEVGQVHRREIEAVLTAARPPSMTNRDYIFALFDVGVLHCRSRPRCDGCPLARGCRWWAAPVHPAARSRTAPYRGSLRETRGAVLRAWLSAPRPADRPALRARVEVELKRTVGPQLGDALVGLAADGLIDASWCAETDHGG